MTRQLAVLLLFASAAAAQNWQVAFTNPSGCAEPVYIDFNTAGTEYYLACRDGGFYKSTNAGTTWTNINANIQFNPPNGTQQYNQGWTIQYNQHDGSLIAAIGGTGTGNTITFYRSTNDGVSWASINATGYHNSSFGAMTGCAMPTAAGGNLACGGFFGSNNTSEFYSANDGGTTTLGTYTPATSSIFALYNDVPGSVYLTGTENGGTFCSTDQGKTWVNIFAWVNGQNGNQFAITSDKLGNPIVGTQNGIWRGVGTACGTYTWTQTFSISAVQRGMLRDSSGNLYSSHAANNNNPNSVIRSQDNGVTWKAWDTNMPQKQEVFHFAQNVNDGKIYAVAASNDNSTTGNPSTVYSSAVGSGTPPPPPPTGLTVVVQ